MCRLENDPTQHDVDLGHGINARTRQWVEERMQRRALIDRELEVAEQYIERLRKLNDDYCWNDNLHDALKERIDKIRGWKMT